MKNKYEPTCKALDEGDSIEQYCNYSLSFDERSNHVLAKLTLEEKVGLFFGFPSSPFIPRINLKQWSLDHTCIHGVNKERGVTVFPHAIAQGKLPNGL